MSDPLSPSPMTARSLSETTPPAVESGIFPCGAWDNVASSAPEMSPLEAREPDDVASAFRAWWLDVWRLLRSVGVPERVAFDAVQDTFLTAHQVWDGYLGKSKRKTWLFGIALNVARNYRRRHARSGEDDALLGDDELIANAPGGRGDPWDAACSAESMRILERVLSTLDETDRQLFVLVTLHDMTVTETAKLLGLVESKARNRLPGIKSRLAAELTRQRAQDEWRLR